jgi:hypothetical protein
LLANTLFRLIEPEKVGKGFQFLRESLKGGLVVLEVKGNVLGVGLSEIEGFGFKKGAMEITKV